MKKVLIFLIVLFFASNVLALSGVKPASYSMNYKEGAIQEFDFDFYIDGGEYSLVFVEGDLAKYVKLSKDKLYDRDELKVTVNFDEQLDFDGYKYITIKCGDAVALIKVNFQKENDYFYLDLRAPDAEAGDIIPITFDVSSFGDELTLSPVLKIYSVNNLEVPMDRFEFDLETFNEKTFEKYVGTLDYPSGDYLAIVEVEYKDEIYRYENPFYLGKLDVEVLNYTTNLKEGKVGKFDIYVKNLWNSEIEGLYAQINVVGSDYSFVTPEIDLERMSVGRLEGFFDTKEVYGYEKELDVILYFGNKIKQETFNVEIKKRFDFVLVFVILGSLVILAFIGFMVKKFIDRINKIPGGGE